MKDNYYNDFSSDKNNVSSEEIQERLKQKKYDEIIRRQRNAQSYNDEYIGYQRQQGTRGYQNNSNYPDFDDIPSDNNNNNRNRQQKQPKKKKKNGCGCGCGTFLLIILLIISLTVGGAYSLCNKTNYVKSERAEATIADDSYVNVLLIGTDKDSNGTSRSDSMILVTIDKENKKLKFTSFMRDTWVEIPDNGEAKLNAAYAYGGAELLMDTIEQSFKVDIDNYVMVNFDMFEKLIDALGGVTVEITEEEAEFMNRTTSAKVNVGTNTLNGDYALTYCRIRKLDSDFMRTQRQRKVLTALFGQITDNPLKAIKGMTEVIPLVTTDISPIKLTCMVFSAVSLLSYSNDDMRIPVDGAYENKMMYGQDSLVPDLEENQEALREFIESD